MKFSRLTQLKRKTADFDDNYYMEEDKLDYCPCDNPELGHTEEECSHYEM